LPGTAALNSASRAQSFKYRRSHDKEQIKLIAKNRKRRERENL
jgi:hypothetical protein